MKKYIYIILSLLMLLPSAPLMAQQTTELTAKEIQAQARRERQLAEKERAQLKRDREKAKRQRERDRAKSKKDKERAKKEATKQKLAQIKADEQARLDRWAADEAHKHQEIRAREHELLTNDSLTKEDRKRLTEEIRILRKNTDKTKYSKGDNLHFLNIYGGVGYSGLVNKYKSVSTNYGHDTYSSKFTGLAGGNIGLAYELQHKHFLFNIGPEIRLISSQDRFNFNVDIEQPDYSETMVQHFATEKSKERNLLGQVMLPVMFGGKWNAFYFLVGGKVGYTLLTDWNHLGDLKASVSDSWAVDPQWNNLINQGYETKPYKEHTLYAGPKKTKNNFGLDVTASAEVGMNIDPYMNAEWRAMNDSKPRPWRMRIALFADYGVWNQNSYAGTDENPVYMVTKSEGLPIEMPFGGSHANQIQTNSIHQTEQAKANPLNSLLVGVKFIAQVQFTKPKQPNPYMNIQLVDSFTHEPILKGGKISLHMVGDTRKPKMRGCKRDGVMHQRVATGEYDLQALAKDYLDGDPFIYDHFGEMHDTMVIALIPRPDLVVFVHSKVDSSLLEANVRFFNYTDSTVIEDITSKDEKKPLHMYLHYGDKYRLDMEYYDFHRDSAEISYLYDTVHYYLRPKIHIKHKLILKHMYFAFNKVEILPESEPEVLRLYQFLVDNPKIRVQIEGHTDDIGTVAYNQRLSEGRANSLLQEMIRRGIDPERMVAVGKGELEPIDTNKTAKGRQNNRRIEVIVLNEDEAGEDIL